MGTNLRTAVAMSPAEVERFLQAQRTAVMCTLLADGRIHAVPMWFLPEASTLYFSAKSKSQKVMNARRDDRATVLVEAGVTYGELRGVQMHGAVEVIDEPALVTHYASRLAERYGSNVNTELSLAEKTRNRSVLRFVPATITSWDHAKIAMRPPA